MESEPRISWVARVSSSLTPVSRLKLQFFEPTVESAKVVVSPPPEVEATGSKKWDFCLIGYFLDAKLPLAVVISITRKLWAKFGLTEVLPHGNGFLVFRFSQPSGAKEALEGGPWLIAGRHIFLDWWKPGFSWQKEGVSKVPVWVQLHNVPLEYWNAEGLSYLASAVGNPLYADSITESCRRLTFARVCVEIDAAKPMINEFLLHTNSGAEEATPKFLTIKVVYQWKPPVCLVCELFGHSTSSCPANANSCHEGVISEVSDVSNKPIAPVSGLVPDQTWRVARHKGKSGVLSDGTPPLAASTLKHLSSSGGSKTLPTSISASVPLLNPSQGPSASEPQQVFTDATTSSGIVSEQNVVQIDQVIKTKTVQEGSSILGQPVVVSSPTPVLQARAQDATQSISLQVHSANVGSSRPASDHDSVSKQLLSPSGNQLPSGLPVPDSPSPTFPSKLASKVKWIDGALMKAL